MADVERTNDYGLGVGENLPNHTMSLSGLGKYIRQTISIVPTFRTRQAAYRYAAWLVTLADVLPDAEDQKGYSFEDVLDAVRNS